MKTGATFHVLLAFLKMLYDIYDVYTDCEYYYKYENLGLVHRGIYRNEAVSFSILVFAISGMVKVIVAALFLVMTSLDVKDEDHESFSGIRYIDGMVLFIMEDCAENFLEYFYIEKFAVGGEGITHTMIIKIFINVLMYGFTFYKALKEMRWSVDSRNEIKSETMIGTWFDFVFFLFPLMFICFGNFLRLFGAFFQDRYGKLDDNCVAVVDGRLIQTPFTNYPGNCMRIWEYFFIIFNFYPLFGYLGFLIHRRRGIKDNITEWFNKNNQ